MSLNYFKKILMSGLNVKEKTTLEEELNPLETAVQYTPQELTEEQLIQVRKNLGLHYSGVKTVNLEWDKDTTGRAAIVISTMPPRVAYKVSDTVFSEDDLIGTSLTFDYNFTQKVTKENVVTPCAGFTIDSNKYWFSANAGEYPELSITVEESGTYFTLSEYQPTPLSMSNEININWDGDTTEKPRVTDNDGDFALNFYKVSSEMPPSDCLIGGSYSITNIPYTSDKSLKIYAEQIEQCDPYAYRVECWNVPSIGTITTIIVGTAGWHNLPNGGGYGVNLPENGMYFYQSSDSGAFVSNLSYQTNAIHKIEQQYIPDTIATKLYVDQQIRDAIREAYNT